MVTWTIWTTGFVGSTRFIGAIGQPDRMDYLLSMDKSPMKKFEISDSDEIDGLNQITRPSPMIYTFTTAVTQ